MASPRRCVARSNTRWASQGDKRRYRRTMAPDAGPPTRHKWPQGGVPDALPRTPHPRTRPIKKSRRDLVRREPYRPLCVAKGLGVSAMPSSAYFRRQADICLRLSLIASDEEVSSRLITMSREYLAKSDALAGDDAG